MMDAPQSPKKPPSSDWKLHAPPVHSSPAKLSCQVPTAPDDQCHSCMIGQVPKVPCRWSKDPSFSAHSFYMFGSLYLASSSTPPGLVAFWRISCFSQPPLWLAHRQLVRQPVSSFKWLTILSAVVCEWHHAQLAMKIRYLTCWLFTSLGDAL